MMMSPVRARKALHLSVNRMYPVNVDDDLYTNVATAGKEVEFHMLNQRFGEGRGAAAKGLGGDSAPAGHHSWLCAKRL
jgi:hypothetical protein